MYIAIPSIFRMPCPSAAVQWFEGRLGIVPTFPSTQDVGDLLESMSQIRACDHRALMDRAIYRHSRNARNQFCDFIHSMNWTTEILSHQLSSIH
jgi:hypothetical protein